MSLKSKTIFPAGLPNMPVGKHACMMSMLVGRTRKYQSWNLLIPSGRRWMSRFGRKGLPLSYVFGQSFDHLMASTFGYCFAIWWSLLVTASLEPHDGTFFNLVLRLELVIGIPLGHRRDVFDWNINWPYVDWNLLSKFPFRHVLIFLCITFFRRHSLGYAC